MSNGEQGASVLVVDDDESICGLTTAILEGAGYRVDVAQDGDTALALLDRSDAPYDVVIIDVVLPGLGGPAVAEEVRRRTPNAGLLFISGHGAGAAEALKRGGEDASYLRKPFSPDQLTQQVEELLET